VFAALVSIGVFMALVLINVLPNAADIVGHDSSVVNNHVVIINAKYYDYVNKTRRWVWINSIFTD
jgi:hypothetical protein